MPRALVIKQIEGKPGKVYYPYAPHFNPKQHFDA